jgi:c-di-GMP-related signal transduction protein
LQTDSKVLSNSFLTIGIDRLAGGKKAFINFTRELLVQKVPTMFPPKSLIIEILEDVEPEETVVAACQEMAREGYEIALDDFFYRARMEPLIALAKTIKIDLRITPVEEIEKIFGNLAAHKVRFLAEKVETYEEFHQALGMGFEYFQGYFFSKPEVLRSRTIVPAKLNLLQIMAKANSKEFSFAELEELIQRDISVSYKLMRYINSAHFKRIREISSIKQAIVLLGEEGIRRFVSLVVMANLAGDKPEELIRASTIRARLCELLGTYRGGMDPSQFFTVGLFSLIDAILDDAMEHLMEKLPFSERIKQALVKGAGELGDYLNLTASYEKGDWDGVSHMASKIGVEEERIPGYYVDAVGWADSYPVP